MNSTELTWQLVDPWTKSGWLILGGAAALLTLLTLWTYWGVRHVGRRRIATVLALRLLALLIACLLLTRPGLAVRDTTPVPSKLLVLMDASKSMGIRDCDGQSRWEEVRRIWRSEEVRQALERLQNEQQVELVYYQGAEGVGKLNLDGEPRGSRTHIGAWLQRLREHHVKDGNLRGLLLFSDFIDNGGRGKAEDAAGPFREMNCPIYTFLVGKTSTDPLDRDVAVVAVKAVPATAAVKAPLRATAVIDVNKFDRPTVTVHLFAEGMGDGNPVATRQVLLEKARGNEVELGPIFPERAGELKLTVKVEKLIGETNDRNNEMSTYVNVTREGISVLWVEGRPRPWEPVFALRYALLRDPRFRVTYTEPPPGGFAGDWYEFKKRAREGQQYDVIVIGDISAQQFSGGQAATVAEVSRLVKEKGVGLLMLAGRQTFANSDWQEPQYDALTKLLPVQLPAEKPEKGRVAGPVKLEPTSSGLAYLLRLDAKDAAEFWKRDLFEPLDGMVPLGTPRPGATVYANSDSGKPLLVGDVVSGARVLAFGADTTWKAWRRKTEAVAAYERFWKQVILWLAKQEETPGVAWIKPDTRRELAGAQKRVGFLAGMRGKKGEELKDAKLWAQMIGPDGKKVGPRRPLTGVEKGGRHGLTPEIDEPGEYTIEVTAEGVEDGKPVTGTAKARFLAYTEDIEMARWAADDKLLEELARRSGGRVIAGEDQLLALLQSLGERAAADDRTRVDRWPDWGQKPLSESTPDQLQALWGSGALLCMVAFTLLICTEWLLRRRWGLV